MQNNQDDFSKDDKSNGINGPDQKENNDEDDNFGQDEAMAIRDEESVGPWQGAVGRQSGQDSQAAGPQIRSLAPTGACRTGLSKA